MGEKIEREGKNGENPDPLFAIVCRNLTEEPRRVCGQVVKSRKPGATEHNSFRTNDVTWGSSNKPAGALHK